MNSKQKQLLVAGIFCIGIGILLMYVTMANLFDLESEWTIERFQAGVFGAIGMWVFGSILLSMGMMNESTQPKNEVKKEGKS